MLSARCAVIVVELSQHRRCIGRGDLRQGYIARLPDGKLDPALFGDILQSLASILFGHRMAEAAAALASHVVHADRGDSPHTGINLSSGERKATAGTNADDANAIPSDLWLHSQK